jgi:hypothetical protein
LRLERFNVWPEVDQEGVSARRNGIYAPNVAQELLIQIEKFAKRSAQKAQNVWLKVIRVKALAK